MKENKGKDIYEFAARIFPMYRSITGEGVRETLAAISKRIEEIDGVGLTIKNIPSGTNVFDWNVPKEWRIRDAYIEDESGKRIIDFKNNNLHVVGYSVPVDKWVPLEELKEYIYVQEDQPDVIPYVTSYYKERFGFCMSKNQRDSLREQQYHIYIDSELFDGNLTYGEIIIPGKTDKEIFFSTYDCHPSMANNECSGPALMTELIRYIKLKKDRYYTYRFIIIPETIGSITYLAIENHLEYMKQHVIAGFNLTCVGDSFNYSIVESRYANTLADRVLNNVLRYHTGNCYKKFSFLQRGSDERQYNAPGVDLPVVAFCRTKYEEYEEYHTSADDMSFVSEEGFQGSYEVMIQVLEALESNQVYQVNVLCEPQLGKRGLYPTISQKDTEREGVILLNVIAYMDGTNDLLAISDKIGTPMGKIIELVDKLKEASLIKEIVKSEN